MPDIQSMPVEILYHESNVGRYFPVSPLESIKAFGLVLQNLIGGHLLQSAQAFNARSGSHEVFQVERLKIGNVFKIL